MLRCPIDAIQFVKNTDVQIGVRIDRLRCRIITRSLEHDHVNGPLPKAQEEQKIRQYTLLVHNLAEPPFMVSDLLFAVL